MCRSPTTRHTHTHRALLSLDPGPSLSQHCIVRPSMAPRNTLTNRGGTWHCLKKAKHTPAVSRTRDMVALTRRERHTPTRTQHRLSRLGCSPSPLSSIPPCFSLPLPPPPLSGDVPLVETQRDMVRKCERVTHRDGRTGIPCAHTHTRGSVKKACSSPPAPPLFLDSRRVCRWGWEGLSIHMCTYTLR